ncbi:hypothetical protein COU79_01555 [Candidatus Peregrinibacteria bacterium CG10_big_fil_rev_8_21_14_0_10_54_7]|nr:MAG: hypothetical protein COU79_01555 [Candidatus Peregrinibacteria bacterium CG10_big_fil_rev_8_21_14_0_10_54_7]
MSIERLIGWEEAVFVDHNLLHFIRPRTNENLRHTERVFFLRTSREKKRCGRAEEHTELAHAQSLAEKHQGNILAAASGALHATGYAEANTCLPARRRREPEAANAADWFHFTQSSMNATAKPTLVCLHGWGGSAESFTELRKALEGVAMNILTPNLPGFGGEPEPAEPWTVDDYADWTEQYIRERAEGPLFLLGHSHGGRIGIKLATRNTLPIEHLILCAAAGIRRPRHARRIIGLTLAKGGKILLSFPGCRHLQPLGRKMLYKLVRIHDYEKASPTMRQTLIEVTKEDLRPLLKRIAVPTDIYWGTADRMTPYKDAKVMCYEIPHSELHAFEGTRHAVHRDRAEEIAERIRDLLTPSAE